MSTTIDNKVVSMEFQNDRFEKNIAQTQSSLERLKKSLKFNGASKGFEELQKSADKVDLNTIANSIDNINSRFNVMTYAAASAVANITDRFVNMGINLGKSLSIDQLVAGWDKYNEKTANVQTIMNATGKSIEEVNDILGELQWFSDETSYSFTQMTKAFADMTSKGGEADKVKDVVMGIAEATAFAGKTGNEFNRVIYNLTQAYGTGLKAIDWMSIENAGVNTEQLVNTLIAAGERAGTIQKGAVTVKTFRNSLAKGWVTSEVMEDAFSGWYAMMKEANRLVNDEHAFDTAAEAIESLEGQYDSYVEKATKAAQTAKSFSEAIDATKDAVSSQWSQIWEAIFGNYEQATELWTEVVDGMWDAFVGPVKDVADSVKVVMSLNGAYGDFTERLKTAGIDGETFRNELVKIGVETGVLDQATVDAEESIDALFNGEKGSWLSNNIIVTALKRFRGEMDTVSTATNAVTMSFEELEEVAKRVIRGEFGVGVTRMEALEKAGYKAAAVQDIVNKMMRGQAINAEDYADALIHLTDEQGNNIELTEEQIAELDKLIKETGDVEGAFKSLAEEMTKPSGRELLIDSFRILIQNTWAIVERFKESYRTIFPKKTTSEVYSAIEAFHRFAESLVLNEESLDKLTRSFNGLFAAIDIILKVVSIPLRFALKVLDVVLRAFGVTTLDVTANIGDAIVAFREWLLETGPLAKAFENTAEFVGNLIIKIKDLWRWFKDLPWVSKTAEFFGKVWEKIVSIFSELKSRIDAFRKSLKDLKNKDSLSLKNVWSAFKKDILHDFQDISDWFDKFKESGSKVGEAFSDAFNAAKIKTGGFLAKLKEFGSSMLDAIFGEENGGAWGAPEIVAILSGVAVAKLTSAFAGAVRSFEGLSGAAEGVLNSISGMFKNLAGIFKSFKYQVWTMGLLNIAKAVLFLAGAIFILAKIPAEDLDRSIDGIQRIIIMFGALTAVIAGLSILVNKFGGGGFLKIGEKIRGKFGGFFALAMTVLSMAMALLAMAGALKLVSDIDTDTLWQSVGVLSVMIAVLTTFATLANIYSEGMAGGALTILAMGLAMKSMAKAMKELNDLIANDNVNWGKLYLTIISIGTILMAFTAIFGAFGKRLDWKASLTVVGIAIAFRLIVKALDDIGDLDGDKIRQNADLVLAAIGVLMAVVVSTIFLGKNVQKAGNAVIGIVAGLALLVFVVKMTQDMDVEQSMHTIKMLMPLMIGIGVLLAASYLAGEHAAKAGVMIAAAGFAMVLMAVAIKALASMSESDLWKATKILLALEAMLAVLVMATTDIKTSKFSTEKGGKAAPILAIGIVIAILAALLYLITKYGDLEKFDAAVKSLSILMISVAGLLFAMSKLESVKIKIGTLITIVLILAALGAIVSGLSWIANGNIKPKQLLTMVASIGILAAVMLGITAVLKIFGSKKFEVSSNYKVAMKRLTPALFTIVTLAVVLATVSNLMNKNITPTQLLALAASVQILASTVLGMTLALNYMTKTEPKMTVKQRLGTLLESFLAVAGLLAGLVYLTKEFNTEIRPDQLLALGDTVAILAAVVFGIGEAISLMGHSDGSIKAASKGLVVLLEGIVAFAAIILALYGINWILNQWFPDDLIERTKQIVTIADLLGQAIGAFVGNVYEEAIVGIIDGLSRFGNCMEVLGESIDKSGLTMDKVELMLALIGVLAALTAESFLDGARDLLDKLPGLDFEIDYDDFKKLGEALADFNDATKDIKSKRADTLIKIAKSIGDITNALQIASDADSLDNIDEFPDAAKKLGEGLVAFGEGCKGINITNVKLGVEAGNLISTFQKGLYGSGGVVQAILGEKDMSQFGGQCSALAVGIKSFSNNITGTNKDNVQLGVDCGNLIAGLQKGFYGSGGFLQVLLGEKDMSKFGEQASSLATGIAGFSENIKGADKNNVELGVGLANQLAGIDVDKMDGFVQLFSGTTDLGTFGTKISQFATGLSNFINKMKEYTATDFNKANAAVKVSAAIADIKPNVEDLDDFLSDETADLFDDLIEKINEYCATLLDTISDYYSDMEAAGKEFINAFFDGAMGRTDDVGLSSFVKNVSDNIAASAHNFAQNITSGVNIGVAGIRAGGFSGNVNMDMSQLNGTLTLLNSKLNGTMKVDLHEITNALGDIKGLMSTQNDLLRGIASAIVSGGNVYLDGNVLTGYVDRKLGILTGPMFSWNS